MRYPEFSKGAAACRYTILSGVVIVRCARCCLVAPGQWPNSQLTVAHATVSLLLINGRDLCSLFCFRSLHDFNQKSSLDCRLLVLMNKRQRLPSNTAAVATPLEPNNETSLDLNSPPRSSDTSTTTGREEALASPVSNRENADVSAVIPLSPASNRDRFRASMMPAQVTCDLSNVIVEPGSRFTFQGIVLVVFPASTNPSRRHVLIGDGRGVVGITVWNAHVNSFSSESIGQLLVVSKVSVVVHNGTRGVTLNKESTVQFNTLTDHFATNWWQDILQQRAISAILFCDQKDNAVVNVAGIVGSVSVEQKTVRSDARDLVTIRLVDRTGVITLRTWNHHSDTFLPLVDSPVMFRRVRVTSFATQKTGELFDGSGTILDKSAFPGADDLAKFWSE